MAPKSPTRRVKKYSDSNINRDDAGNIVSFGNPTPPPATPTNIVFTRPTGTDISRNVIQTPETSLASAKEGMARQKIADFQENQAITNKLLSEEEAKILSEQKPAQIETEQQPIEQQQAVQENPRKNIKDLLTGETLRAEAQAQGGELLGGSLPLATTAGFGAVSATELVASKISGLFRAQQISTRTAETFRKALSFKNSVAGLIGVGSAGTLLRVMASDAKGILGNSKSEINDTITALKEGSIDYANAKEKFDKAKANAISANNDLNRLASINYFNFLGIKDNLVDFEYALQKNGDFDLLELELLRAEAQRRTGLT